MVDLAMAVPQLSQVSHGSSLPNANNINSSVRSSFGTGQCTLHDDDCCYC